MPLLALLAALSLAPADTVRVVLVATTDVHGYATDWDYLQNAPWPGGLARAATVVDSLRAAYPGQVVLVDGGDALQGSPFAAYFGRIAPRDPNPVIEAMNLLGYDAATPGDHDFDFGADALEGAVGRSAFPWVSGNIRRLPVDTLAFAPYTVVVRNNVRVAIGGFTSPAAMVSARDELQGRFRVGRVPPAAPEVLRNMRRDGDLVVVLAHTGLSGRSSYDTTGVGAEHVAAGFAAGQDRPDLVVVGHAHRDIADTVIGGVHFVEPAPEGRGLAVVEVALVSRAGRLVPVRIKAREIRLGDVRPSARVMRRLDESHRAVLGWAATVVGNADGRFPAAAARVEDTPLMRFITGVERRAARADLATAPVYDLRAGLDPGAITEGELFRLYPYEYTLRAVRLSGADLKDYLERSAYYFYADSTGLVAPNRYVPGPDYDVLGGARYTIDLSKPMGSRITRLEVRGRPVAPTDSFTLALSSFRQQGGGNYGLLARLPVVFDRGEPIRDLLAAEVRRLHSIRPEAYAGSDWGLAPEDYAARARALFVRAPGPASAPVAQATPPPLQLPMAPTRRELQRRDSIAEVRQRADSIANAAVATLRLPAESGAQHALARLLADAYRNALRADVAIVLGEETGAPLPAGGVTAAQIEAAAPGQGHLLTIRLRGDELQDVLEHVVESDRPCCELSGIRLTYKPRHKPLDRVDRARLVSGESIEGKQTYVVAISERLVDGDSLFRLGATDCREGKGCRTPGSLSRWKVERTPLTSSDVLREYLRRLPQPVSPPSESRIVAKD